MFGRIDLGLLDLEHLLCKLRMYEEIRQIAQEASIYLEETTCQLAASTILLYLAVEM
jgi:hypothetical protein